MMTRLHNMRMVAAVGLVLAAGAALTACQGSDSSDAAAPSGGTQTSAVATADGGTVMTTAPDAATSTTAPPAKAGNGGKSGAANGGAGAPATTTRCRTSHLGFSFGPDSGAQSVDSQGGIDVVLTNNGSDTCTLDGFPGVDVISKSGTHWSLARQGKSAGNVTLRSGADASFDITYLPFNANNSGGSAAFHAASLLITPPGETHSATLKWGFADVMDQSGATHPGTYVGPVAAGGGR